MKLKSLYIALFVLSFGINTASAWCGYKSGLEDPKKISWGMKAARIKDAATRCNDASETERYTIKTKEQPCTKTDRTDCCDVGVRTIANSLNNLAAKCNKDWKHPDVQRKCNAAYSAIRKADTDYRNYSKPNLEDKTDKSVSSLVFGCV